MIQRPNKWQQFYYVAALLLAAPLVFTFSGCSTTQSQPPPPSGSSSIVVEEGVAGGTFTQTIEVNAKVTAIHRDSRKATLQDSDGEEFTVTVGPEAVNFDQIQIGDIVKAVVTEELVVSLLPESAAHPDGRALKSFGYIDAAEVEPAPDGSTGIVALAMKGSQPGGLMARTVQVTATVKAIDKVNHKVTLSFKDGSTKTFPVRDDIDLSQHKAGERVVFHATEMIAVSVEKP